jgi:hypothetical protein
MAEYQTSQTNSYLDQINKQRQTPYASRNGMNTGGPAASQTQQTQQTALQGAIAGTGSGSTAPTQAPSAPAPASTPSASAPPTTGTSPVTGDGKINELNVPVQQPAPAPIAQAPGQTAWGEAIPQGWTEQDMIAWRQRYPSPDYTAYTSGVTTQQALQPSAPAPVAGNVGSAGSTATVFRDGAGMPLRAGDTQYAPGTISQYTGGINAPVEAATQDALLRALAGGGGLPTELLKGQLRDDTLAMRDNELQEIQGSMAASGRTGGGFSDAMLGNARESALKSLLGGYRDIGIQDALSRNQFGLQAIGLGDQFLGNQQNRFQNDYKTHLSGQLAQEDLLQAGAKNSRDNYLADLQGFLGKYGADKSAESAGNVANIGADADRYRSKMGLLGDVLNIMERARATDMGTAADWGRIQATVMGNL